MYALLVYALVGTDGSVHIQTIKVEDCSILPSVEEIIQDQVDKSPILQGFTAKCIGPDITA